VLLRAAGLACCSLAPTATNTLTNTGTIRGNSAATPGVGINAGNGLVVNSSTAATIFNSGTIEGRNSGRGIWANAFGIANLTVVNSGTFRAGANQANAIEFSPSASATSVLEQLRPNLSLGASYAGQFGDGLKDHGFKVNMNWAF
jgi:uncharacterized protein with beta-barrel porin domain